MSARLTHVSLVLIAALAIAASQSRAAPSDDTGARKALRATAFEVAAPALGGGRFRLSARLSPAPAPAVRGELGTLKLNAVLVPQATVAACPLPGAIFSDGFESP